MVICKFYLQGNCRFGNNCKFEHQINDFNAAVSTSILRQPQPQQPQQQNVDINTAIRSVVNDMLLAEKGRQWLLSYYAPFRAKPAFPGFNDMSFEEIRYGFLTAQRNGTIEQYKQQLQTMLHEAVMRTRALQNPTPDLLNIIKQLFTGSESTTKNNFSFAEAGKSVLQQNTNIFQQKPQSIFAQANQALFGSQSTQQQSNVFGGQQPTNSIFAPQQPTGFSAQTQWPQQQPANVFQTTQQQPANVFQTTQQPANVFQQQQTNVFQQQPIQVHQMSIFGGGANLNVGKAANLDDAAYSRREVLTESEIRAFEADLFEFGQIPDKPPTLEMCF